MKLYRLLIYLFVLWPAVVFAADAWPPRIIMEGEILRGKFIQKTPLKGINQLLQSEGNFVVAPEYGIIWSVEKPMAMTFVFTPNGMVQSIGGVPLLQQSAHKNPFLGKVTDLLATVLGGNWKKLEQDYKITGKSKAGNWKIKIEPRPSCSYKTLFRSITAKGSKYIDYATVLRLDGLEETFTFSNQRAVKANLNEAEILAFQHKAVTE